MWWSMASLPCITSGGTQATGPLLLHQGTASLINYLCKQQAKNDQRKIIRRAEHCTVPMCVCVWLLKLFSDMPVWCFALQQVTCGRVPVGACFHDAARCVFTSVRMYGRRGWAWACCCSRWQLRHSEVSHTLSTTLVNQLVLRSQVAPMKITHIRGAVLTVCLLNLAGAVDEFLHLRQELREEVLRASWGGRQDHLDDQPENHQLRRRRRQGQGRVAEPQELGGEHRRVLRRRRAHRRRVSDPPSNG